MCFLVFNMHGEACIYNVVTPHFESAKRVYRAAAVGTPDEDLLFIAWKVRTARLWV
jgi:hypothetical protein